MYVCECTCTYIHRYSVAGVGRRQEGTVAVLIYGRLARRPRARASINYQQSHLGQALEVHAIPAQYTVQQSTPSHIPIPNTNEYTFYKWRNTGMLYSLVN